MFLFPQGGSKKPVGKVYHCGEPGCDFTSKHSAGTSRHRIRYHGIYRKPPPGQAHVIGHKPDTFASMMGSMKYGKPQSGQTNSSTNSFANAAVSSNLNLTQESDRPTRPILNIEVDQAIREHFSQETITSQALLSRSSPGFPSRDSPSFPSIQNTLNNVIATSGNQPANINTSPSDNLTIQVSDNRGNSNSTPQMKESHVSNQVINPSQVVNPSQVITPNQMISPNQVINPNQMISPNQVMSPDEVINLDEDSDDENLIEWYEDEDEDCMITLDSPPTSIPASPDGEIASPAALVNQHVKKSNYKECVICGQLLSNNWALKRHLLSHKNGNRVNSEKSKFKCAVCGLNLQGLQGLERHLEIIHAIKDRTEIRRLAKQCTNIVTPRTYTHLGYGKIYAKRRYPNTTADPNHKCEASKCHKCPECGLCLATQFSLKRHMKNLHDINMFDAKKTKKLAPSSEQAPSTLSNTKQASNFVPASTTTQSPDIVNLNIGGNYVNLVQARPIQEANQALNQGTSIVVLTPLDGQASSQGSASNQLYIPLPVVEAQASNPQTTTQTPINIEPIEMEEPSHPEPGSTDVGTVQSIGNLNHNSGTVQTAGNLVCAVCQNSFNDLVMFKAHECNLTSTDRNVFPCQACNHIFPTQKKLIEHMFIHARVPEPGSQQPSRGSQQGGHQASSTASHGSRPQAPAAPRPHVCQVNRKFIKHQC